MKLNRHAFGAATQGAQRISRPLLALVAVLSLGMVGCSSTPAKLQPLPLTAPANKLSVGASWNAQIGASRAALTPVVADGRLFVASQSGAVAQLDVATGQDVWRFNVGAALGAGVGSDGQTAAVVTLENQLVALREGKLLWKAQLPARSFTAPLVAGGRVFVLMADRSVSAFDGGNGARLWTQSRPSEPLVLGQGGVLIAVGDTLVAGLSSRMTGFDPNNGAIRWQALLAPSRGTNEIERLVDLVGTVSRDGNSVCGRAFGAAVGCVDAAKGTPLWNKPAQGSNGLGGDVQQVYGSENNGLVLAWDRATGAPAWSVDRLKNRPLTSPLSLGRSVAVGDADGLVHLFSREDGSDMARLTTDGSAIVSAPVLAGQWLIVQTQKGGVFAWRPQ